MRDCSEQSAPKNWKHKHKHKPLRSGVSGNMHLGFFTWDVLQQAWASQSRPGAGRLPRSPVTEPALRQGTSQVLLLSRNLPEVPEHVHPIVLRGNLPLCIPVVVSFLSLPPFLTQPRASWDKPQIWGLCPCSALEEPDSTHQCSEGPTPVPARVAAYDHCAASLPGKHASGSLGLSSPSHLHFFCSSQFMEKNKTKKKKHQTGSQQGG